MQDGQKVYMNSYMDHVFHGQMDYFQKPPLGDRSNTKPGLRMNRNSLKEHLVESSVTYDFNILLKST
jgi:hypothetical protein